MLLEDNIRGGLSSVLRDTYVKPDENKKILDIDATNLYGWALSEPVPYDEIETIKNVKLVDILNTPGHSDIGYFIEVDSKYPDEIQKKN